MKIKLWDKMPLYNEKYEAENCMETYFLDTDKKLPCIVIFPGGGYTHYGSAEQETIAKFYNDCGYHAVVVKYRLIPYRYPCALMDCQRAVKLVRYNADKWNINENQIFTIGFSAGGHLCGLVATMKDLSKNGDELDNISPIPNGAISGYGALLTDDFMTDGIINMFKSLVEETDVDYKDLSVADLVSENTPPFFLWHSSEDAVVKSGNSLKVATALAKFNIPYELHIFPQGPHGNGLALNCEDTSKWAEMSRRWIERIINN